MCGKQVLDQFPDTGRRWPARSKKRSEVDVRKAEPRDFGDHEFMQGRGSRLPRAPKCLVNHAVVGAAPLVASELLQGVIAVLGWYGSLTKCAEKGALDFKFVAGFVCHSSAKHAMRGQLYPGQGLKRGEFRGRYTSQILRFCLGGSEA